MFASPRGSLFFKILLSAMVAGICGAGYSFYERSDQVLTQQAIQSQIVYNMDGTRVNAEARVRKTEATRKKVKGNSQEMRRIASLMVLLPFIPRDANG